MTELDNKIAELKKLIEFQCTDGTWNYDAYQFGMANGMIFALSVLTNKTPKYLGRPAMFLIDAKTLDKFNKSSIIVKYETAKD